MAKPNVPRKKAQAAMEFLSVYGWAILIFVVAIAFFFWTGMLKGSDTTASLCVMQGDMRCAAYALNTSGGLILDLENNKADAINITAIRCTDETNPSFNATDNLTAPVTLRTGEHALISAADHYCYKTVSGTPVIASGELGNGYRGRVYVKYTELVSGMSRVTTGEVALKFENASVNPTGPAYSFTGWAYFQPIPQLMNSLWCDGGYCYAGYANGVGNFSKISKDSGLASYTVIPNFVAPDGWYHIHDIYCDDTYCYNAHDWGYFSKVRKSDGAIIWNNTIGTYYVGQPPGSMNSIWCDALYCYGGHDDGYLSKFDVNTGAIVWDSDVRPDTTDMRSNYCDDSACYGIHADGNITKTDKTSGAVQWNRNANANAGNEIWCVDDYCYTGHENGRLAKVAKTDGSVQWTAQPFTVEQNEGWDFTALWCDSAECIMGDSSGYVAKVNTSNGGIVWGDAEYVRPTVSRISGLMCDTTYCYIGDMSGFFSKIVKANGDVVWGGSGQQHMSEYHVWGVYCDDTYCYGSHYTGRITKVLKSNATVVWEEMVLNQDANGVWCDDTYCYAGHDDGEYSKMYKNGTAVGHGGFDASSVNGIYCESGYCYGAQSDGNITKLIMTDGTMSFSTRPHSAVANDLFCDSFACFIPYADGYTTAVNKTDGATIWSVRPYDANATNDISCDGTYCYGAHDNGYVSKMSEATGAMSWNSTTPLNIDDSHGSGNYNDMSAINCIDADACYLALEYDMYKISKTDGSTVWRNLASPVPYGITDMWCDSSFCYHVGWYGFFGRTNKLTGASGD